MKINKKAVVTAKKPAKKPEKRAYHHSEAWLAKHAEKTQQPQESVEVKHRKPRKQMAKKPVKKPLAKGKKSDSLKKTEKKLTLKEAIKLFDQIKKSVSLVKKNTKSVGKFLTETMKTGDTKHIEKTIKLFSRIGYVCNDNVLSLTCNAKVKAPKLKAPKLKAPKITVQQPEENTETPKCGRPRKSLAKISEEFENPEKKVPAEDVFDNAIVIEDSDLEEVNPLLIEDPTVQQPQENDSEESAMTEDEIAEAEAQRAEELEIEREEREREAEAREEMWNEMSENGDFS